MSEADEGRSGARRFRQRKRLTILRDDHIGDPVGVIFFDLGPEHEEALVERMRTYLGAKVRVLKIEMTSARAEVEVEFRAFPEEAARLAAVAGDLSAKGANRNALALFEQALELDPFSREARMGMGLLLMGLKRDQEALRMLKLARETGPDDAELLLAMGRVCIRLERTASAISYLERANEIEPGNFNVRRALATLGRKPRPSKGR